MLSKCSYLRDRFNCEYLILRFGYPSHFAGTNNCGICLKVSPTITLSACARELKWFRYVQSHIQTPRAEVRVYIVGRSSTFTFFVTVQLVRIHPDSSACLRRVHNKKLFFSSYSVFYSFQHCQLDGRPFAIPKSQYGKQRRHFSAFIIPCKHLSAIVQQLAPESHSMVNLKIQQILSYKDQTTDCRETAGSNLEMLVLISRKFKISFLEH